MENQKKSNTKLIILIIVIVVIVIAIVAIFAFSFFNTVKQRATLFDEINTINETSKVDMTIKTTGEYAKVEKALKEHLKEYYDALDKATESYQNSGLDNMLSADNIAANGPEFTEQKDKLNSLISLGNEVKETLSRVSTEEYEKQKATEAGLEGKYMDLYTEIVSLGENATKNIGVIDANNAYLDKLLQILNFLTSNKDNWKVNGEYIEFSTDELVNTYNTLLSEAKTAAMKITEATNK